MIKFKYNVILGLLFWIIEPQFNYKNNITVLPIKKKIKSFGRTKTYS